MVHHVFIYLLVLQWEFLFQRLCSASLWDAWCLFVFPVIISTRKWWWVVNWWCSVAHGLWHLAEFSKHSNNRSCHHKFGKNIQIQKKYFLGFAFRQQRLDSVVVLCFRAALPEEQEKMSVMSSNNIYIFLWLYCPMSSNAEASSHPFVHLQVFVSWKEVQWGKYIQMLENTSKANCS